MRWKQTGPDKWGLFDTADFFGMPVEQRVAVVKEEVKGVATRHYKVWVTGNQLLFSGIEPITQTFTNLEDALLWAQTTYRLSK